MRALRAAFAALFLMPTACQAERPSLSENGMALIPLTITNAKGASHHFTVEVASSPDQQERGLMFRATLAPDSGMIFPMAPPRYASFWMKNTLIPLDMIFIRPDGRIGRIARETTPYSLVPVESYGPVSAVLEIAGGRSAELGLAEGDMVVWKR